MALFRTFADVEFDGVCKAYGANEVLRRASFTLRHRAGRTLLVATHGQDDARLLGAERINLADVQDGGAATA